MRASTRERITVWGVRVAVVLGLTVAVAQVVSYRFGLHDAVLDSNTDRSVAGVLTLVLLGAAVASAWLVTSVSPSARLETGVMAACLSLILALELSEPSHVVALSAPFGAVAVVLLWRLAATDATAGPVIRAGCVVLGVAFVGHAIGSRLVTALGQGADSWLYQAKGIVKHAGEIVAWTLLAAGLVAVWVARRPARSTLRGATPLARRGRY
ncbi:MAG TPA: hypothetical protein VLU96_13175 [Gaiellaceae bacterium]|nr:hypothetical protein [Gaiellaceae bacterium]